MASQLGGDTKHARQLALLFVGKAVSVIAGKAGGCTDWDVRRIAINHVAGLGHPDRLWETAAQENGFLGLCLFREGSDLVFWEVGRFSMTERRIKLAAQVVTANAVVGVAVEVKELRCAVQEIAVAAQIEIGPHGVISSLAGVLLEQVARFTDQDVRNIFSDVVEVDQIAIDIAQQITVIVGVEEHRTGTDERLNQAPTFRQVLAQCVDNAGFAAQPFKGGFVHGLPLDMP